MSLDLASFGIQRLSVAERLALIEHIWDSLPAHMEPSEVPEWHLAELVKRRRQAEISPGQGTPWREVLDPLEGGR